MKTRTAAKFARLLLPPAACIALMAAIPAYAQTAAAPPPPAAPPGAADRAAIAAASTAEREREMKVLGIAAMQPGVTAYDIGKPGNANYDESKANPYPKLPDVLTMNDGTKVKTPAQWKKRREEIKALFDENVYGKYPAHIPAVTWTVDKVENMTVADVPVIVKHVTGHTDNSAYPAITVDIHADIVTPVSTKGKKVPVIIGGGSIRTFTPPAGPRPAPPPGTVVHGLSAPPDPPNSSKLLLDKGWGLRQPQLQRGAGRQRSRPRQRASSASSTRASPAAWMTGASSAPGPGATARSSTTSRPTPTSTAQKVGVMGHSRGGKAALVAQVDDPRFAIGFISSSGAGGAALFRRNYGETTSSITSNTEFHWFAGNFLKYGSVGHTANELPVDSHEFIALIARAPSSSAAELSSPIPHSSPVTPGRTRRACSWPPQPPAPSGISSALRASAPPPSHP